MTRALVLGGGGPVGIAWEAGLLAGLAEGGVDLAAADMIVGTSAGAFVGAQLAMGRTPSSLAEAIIAEEGRAPPPRPAGASGAAAGAPTLGLLFQKMEEARAGVRDPVLVRQEIGAWALQAKTQDEESFIASFGRSLSEGGEDAWPGRGFTCTAVDAESGAFVAWNAEAGAPLARAVASSCSVPGIFPPITVNGRRYIDGGMRSSTNADLAKGHALTVVVQVRVAGGDPAVSERMRRPFEAELAVLRDAGGDVHEIQPDGGSLAAFGPNLMDGRRRPATARAGLAQGRSLAGGLKAIWG